MSIHYLIDPFTVNGDIIDVTSSDVGQADATGALVINVPDGVPIRGNPSTLGDMVGTVPATPGAKYQGILDKYSGYSNIVFNPCLESSGWDIADFSGGAASISSVGIGSAVVSGLIAMSDTNTGGYLEISGAVNPSNNGTFRIFFVTDPNTVSIENPSAVVEAGPLDWTYRSSKAVSVGNGFSNHCLLPAQAGVSSGGAMRTLDIPLATAPESCVLVWETYEFVNDDPSSGRMLRTYQETELTGTSEIEVDLSFNGGTSSLFTVGNGVAINIPPADQGSTVRVTFVNFTSPTRRVYLGSWALVY